MSKRHSFIKWMNRLSPIRRPKRPIAAILRNQFAPACTEPLERRLLLSDTPSTLYSYTTAALPVGIVVDSSGDIYGTTFNGGAHGDGSVWKIPSGSSTPVTLYSFTDSTDGDNPRGLAIDGSGDLFGSTDLGGAHGDGNIFELASGATSVTPIYAFTSTTDAAEVVYDSGNLYLTSDLGGTYSDGAIWEIPSGNSTPTNLFSWQSDVLPVGLAIDSSGDLYNVIGVGGIHSDGAIGELLHGATSNTILYSFTGGDNGNLPIGLAMDSDGNLFGTTEDGGTSSDGTVWELPSGGTSITTLYSFTDSISDGGSPRQDTIDSHGNLFGVTTAGGASGDGTIFEMSGVAAATSNFQLTTPASAASVDVGSDYTIDWTGGNPTDTVQLWVEGGPTNSWTELTTGVPNSNGSYTWNTTGVDHGWYYFQAYDIPTSGSTYTVQSPNYLHIVDPSAAAPNISLSNPVLAGETVTEGNNYTINFSGTDGAGDTNPIYVQLWVYSGNTGNWTELPNANYIAATQGDYVWDTTGMLPGWYSFAAHATNGDDWSYASSPGWVEIVPAQTPTITFTTPTTSQSVATGGVFNLDWNITGLSTNDLTNATVQIWAQHLVGGSPVWSEIDASVSASGGTYAWTVPTSPGAGTYYAFSIWLNVGDEWWAQASPNWLQIT